MNYSELLQAKEKRVADVGFHVELSELNDGLFPFQKHCVQRALKAGRFAFFQDCGLGKTFQQLEWANQVTKFTRRPVLVLCPLAVAGQTIQEGVKFGITVLRYSDAVKYNDHLEGQGVYISNYEQLENIDATAFAGVVLDESSILKNFTGATKKLLIETFAETPYKLCCTATPSPNDLNEIGNHSDFLNILDAQDMRSKWFVRDEGMNNYRLKGHAKKDFYAWVSSWAIMLTNPKDIGFPMEGYDLPPLNFVERQIATAQRENGKLFNDGAINATNFNAELRLTKVERLGQVADIVNESDEHFLIWIKQNEEGDYLKNLIPDAVEITGSDSLDRKEFVSLWFGNQHNTCTCQNTNTKAESNSTRPNIGQNTTPKIEKKLTQEQTVELKKNESQTQSLGEVESNIIKNTTQKTRTNSTKEHLSKNNEETNFEESNIKETQNLEKNVRQQQNGKENQTSKQIINNDLSDCTDLQLKNTTTCSQNNQTNARYAEQSRPLSSKNNDCMLTTATPQAELEGFYAQTATTDLESLMMMKYCSNVPLCTCCNKPKRKVLISKSKILSFGLNFQNCHNQVFASLDFSFESLYQSIRRSYRFGQQHAVNIYLITTDTMENVISSIKRKEKQFMEMQQEMNLNINSKQYGLLNSYEFKEYKTPEMWLMKGDTCIEIDRLEDNSLDLIVFSPPFSSLFTYSNYIHDMGNNESHEEFFKQYGYLLERLYAKLKPGRMMCCHTKNLGVYKNSSGYTGVYPFTIEHTQAVLKAGFKLHCDPIGIWCDPVLEMQRTKTQRLLYKTLTTDSSFTGTGMSETVTVFKKWEGNQEEWTPITNITKKNFPLSEWQRWASPIWGEKIPIADLKEIQAMVSKIMDKGVDEIDLNEIKSHWVQSAWFDIKRTDVLNNKEGTAMGDEKHIAPLQLEVIHRLVNLWSNKGEIVFTPFGGIGSEPYMGLKNGRKVIACELKDSYFDVMVKNCKKAVHTKNIPTLFAL